MVYTDCPTCAAINALMMARGVSPQVARRVATSSPVLAVDKKVKVGIKRGSSVASKKLSRALKSVNKKARKKNGQLKSGWTQSRVMSTAHRMCRK